MRFGFSDDCLAHDTGPRHPESPDRLRAIKRGLTRKHGVEYVEADPVTEAMAARAHDPDYVESIREFCERGGGNWDPDTVAVEATWPAALRSAGLATWAAEAAVSGAEGRDTPFALGRPPGHHALSDDAMGFCFLNNVAIAARAVIADGSVDRVAIVDWDVHHGNGTQEIFYDDGDVLYASIHEQGLYPGTGEIEETGAGDGEGTTLNVPLPAGLGDADYRAVFAEAIEPAFSRFDPGLILVSAGFDAHKHDPISRMRLSTEGYGVMTARLRDLADRVDSQLGFVLEGGYSLDTLSNGVGIVHEIFDGRDPILPDDDPADETMEIVDEVREVQGLGEK